MPYTAVIPLFLLMFKWCASKLATVGLLPKSVVKLLNLPDAACGCASKGACVSPLVTTGPSRVQTLSSAEEFESLLNEKERVVCKFTASWCGPCKRIQPFYEKCSAEYNADDKNGFLIIDVDDYDEIASKYNITMMPTFAILQKETVLGKYSGSDETELHRFLQKHLLKTE